LNDAGTGLLPVADEQSLARVVDVEHGGTRAGVVV
jgi:hypothetical protein